MPKDNQVDYETMERVMLRAIPAFEEEEIDGWLLRYAGAYTGRANSTYIASTPPDLDAINNKIAVCETWYRQRGTIPRFRLTTVKPFPQIHQKLMNRAYTETHTIQIQTKNLSDHQPGNFDQVKFSFPAIDEWVRDYQALHGLEENDVPKLITMLSTHPGTNCLLRMELDGKLVGVGRGVLDGQFFGLFNFYVHKNYRRKGIASDMIKIMEDWASDQGARLSYLQVDSDNPNAIQLYQKLGYQTIYEYWYLMDSS